MSHISSFLFGNVNEEGRLENSELDEEVLESLALANENEATERFLENILSKDFQDVINEKPASGDDSSSNVQHAKDAIDYSTLDELAEDKSVGSTATTPSSNVSLSSRLFASPPPTISITNKLNSSIVSPPMHSFFSDNMDIKKLYPAFEKDKILKFSELFAPRNYKYRSLPLEKLSLHAWEIESAFKLNLDDFDIFYKPLQDNANFGWLQNLLRSLSSKELVAKNNDSNSSIEDMDVKYDDDKDIISLSEKAFEAVVLEPWEDKIIWDVREDRESEVGQDIKKGKNESPSIFLFKNYELENGAWDCNCFWENEGDITDITKLQLNLNDPLMVFETENFSEFERNNLKHGLRFSDDEEGEGRKSKKQKKNGNKSFEDLVEQTRPVVDKFNLSNDHYYEMHKSVNMARVRQPFQQMILQHSFPAIRLQPPYFKSKLSKKELRLFHRMPFGFKVNEVCTFSKVRSGKRRKIKKKETGEIMRGAKDLTLRDGSNYVLLEYCEEYPPVMSNPGMASLIQNYYRKRDEKDAYIPQRPIGAPYILDLNDPSPFLGFGEVDPGESFPTLYNNLLRAPLFEHPMPETDFLLCRTTLKSNSKYYLRNIPHFFVVGQTFPMQEVPGPHSRKITAIIKGRLQVAAFRLFRKSSNRKLRIQKLAKFFPEYSEPQIRQRLKEFAEFHRTGHNSGWWKLKKSILLPTEDEIRKIITPEMVCLYESMLSGQQNLEDAGYGVTSEKQEEEGNDEKDLSLDIEEQLAPWIVTRNFINATQGKGMVKLYGPGDPTGRGEGFSFIRVSMKDMFLRSDESLEEKLAEIAKRPKSYHKFSFAEQQQAYRDEIQRIWAEQKSSLGNTQPITVTDDESDDDIPSKNLDSPMAMDGLNETSSNPSAMNSPVESNFQSINFSKSGSGINSDDDDNSSFAGSMGSRSNQYGSKNKYLEIKRKIRNEAGEMIWKTEIIHDVRVLNAYLRKRQLIDSQTTSNFENLIPTTVEEENIRRKKRLQEELARLKKSMEKRRARAAARERKSKISSQSRDGKQKRPETVLACGRCGQKGHIRTNKSCPLFAEEEKKATNTEEQKPLINSTPSQASNLTFPNGNEYVVKIEGTKISIPTQVMNQVVNLEKERDKDKEKEKELGRPAKLKKKKSIVSSNSSLTSESLSEPKRQASNSGRRHNPEVDLANIFEIILMQIISLPESVPFQTAVSTKIAKDYYEIIKNPKDLEKIRDSNKVYMYKTSKAFLNEFIIMAENCRLYNGPSHILTHTIYRLTALVYQQLQQDKEGIAVLEKEIRGNKDDLPATFSDITIPSASSLLLPSSHTQDKLDLLYSSTLLHSSAETSASISNLLSHSGSQFYPPTSASGMGNVEMEMNSEGTYSLNMQTSLSQKENEDFEVKEEDMDGFIDVLND